MATAQTNRVITYLHRVALLQEQRRATDAQLLERFLGEREEIAFEELLRRHGPMVYGAAITPRKGVAAVFWKKVAGRAATLYDDGGSGTQFLRSGRRT